MDNQEGRDHETDYDPSPNPGWVTRGIRGFKRRREKSRAYKQHESPVDRAARSTAWATWVIAFLTLVTVGATISTYFILEGQLTEMRTAREGSDNATTDQLKLMRDQTTAMQGQVAQMQVASAQTERAIAATNRLAEEAAKSAIETHRLADAASADTAVSKQIAEMTAQANHLNAAAQGSFIVSNGMQFEQFVPGAAVWIGKVALENSGNSPIPMLSLYYWCVSGGIDITRDPYELLIGDSAFTRKNEPPEFLSFGAKQVRRIGQCMVSRAQAEPQGIRFRTIFGRAEYKDAIDTKLAHVTEFCYIVSAPLFDDEILRKMNMPVTEDTFIQTTIPCREHNCTDEGCGNAAVAQAARDLGLQPAPGITSTRRPSPQQPTKK